MVIAFHRSQRLCMCTPPTAPSARALQVQPPAQERKAQRASRAAWAAGTHRGAETMSGWGQKTTQVVRATVLLTGEQSSLGDWQHLPFSDCSTKVGLGCHIPKVSDCLMEWTLLNWLSTYPHVTISAHYPIWSSLESYYFLTSVSLKLSEIQLKSWVHSASSYGGSFVYHLNGGNCPSSMGLCSS